MDYDPFVGGWGYAAFQRQHALHGSEGNWNPNEMESGYGFCIFVGGSLTLTCFLACYGFCLVGHAFLL